MKDEIMNRAIEAYIEKLEGENAKAKQLFSDISNVFAFDGSRPNRTSDDECREILDILECYERNGNC